MNSVKRKKHVAVLFGGKSAEHEVSLQSAKNIVNSLDKDAYTPVLIGIDKQGDWHLIESTDFLLSNESPDLSALPPSADIVAFMPESRGKLLRIGSSEAAIEIDVVFPVLHGPLGEDGTVQGLLKLAQVPFVGSGVLGSSVGMDKDVMKRLLKEAGIPIGKFITVSSADDAPPFAEIEGKLGSPVFIKPANMGSSVGVTMAHTKEEYLAGIKTAFQFDLKILIEEYLSGREIECSVLEEEEVRASVIGEIKPSHQFYSYEAKYIDENGAALIIPADLPADIIKKGQDLAVRTFKTLAAEGFSRVDMFLAEDGTIYVNEINTIPGFTKISMYPKLWKASGISYESLIDRLIRNALSRFDREEKLKTTYL
jgi:D-alanine-D-alanine ligase